MIIGYILFQHLWIQIGHFTVIPQRVAIHAQLEEICSFGGSYPPRIFEHVQGTPLHSTSQPWCCWSPQPPSPCQDQVLQFFRAFPGCRQAHLYTCLKCRPKSCHTAQQAGWLWGRELTEQAFCVYPYFISTLTTILVFSCFDCQWVTNIVNYLKIVLRSTDLENILK